MFFSRRLRGMLLLFLTPLLFGCSAATPFKKSTSSSLHHGSVYIGVTNAIVEGGNRREFDDHTRRVIKNLPQNEGYLGHSVRSRILGNEVWTMTVWKDEASLDRFVRSSIHREAMREGTPQVLSAKFDRFTWPSFDPQPSWSLILTRLESVEPVDYAARRTEKQNSTEY